MQIQNIKAEVGTKKDTEPKKKPKKRGLDAFSEEVRIKAHKKAEGLDKTGDLRWTAHKSLPLLPKKKEVLKVSSTYLQAVGDNYHRDLVSGNPLSTFLKRVNQYAETLQKKGATQSFVIHDGVTVNGFRDETEEEFKKRHDEVVLDRAVILTARSMQKEFEKKEAEGRKKRNYQRLQDNFAQALQQLPAKVVGELLETYKAKRSKKTAKKR